MLEILGCNSQTTKYNFHIIIILLLDIAIHLQILFFYNQNVPRRFPQPHNCIVMAHVGQNGLIIQMDVKKLMQTLIANSNYVMLMHMPLVLKYLSHLIVLVLLATREKISERFLEWQTFILWIMWGLPMDGRVTMMLFLTSSAKQQVIRTHIQ